MKNELKNYVEMLFENAPQNKKAMDLKEELLTNLEARYDDLVASGMSEAAAYQSAVDSIGDVDELLGELRTQSFIPEESAEDRKKNAMITTICVAIYIFAGIVLFGCGIIGEGNDWIAGVGFLAALVIAAVPTCILVYRNISRPKYRKRDETIVEEFKEWNSDKKRDKAIKDSIGSILWTLIVVIYLAVSFATMKWHITWVIFLIGSAIASLIELFFAAKRLNQYPESTEGYNKAIKSMRGAVSGILWTMTVAIYFVISFSSGAWHITWLIFLIAACVQSVVGLLFNLKMK